jgi:hypothetical protein
LRSHTLGVVKHDPLGVSFLDSAIALSICSCQRALFLLLIHLKARDAFDSESKVAFLLAFAAEYGSLISTERVAEIHLHVLPHLDSPRPNCASNM